MQRLSLCKLIILVSVALTCCGMIAIFAASSLKGAQQFGDEYIFLRKHFASAIFGYLLLGAIVWLPFSLIERCTLPLLFLTVGVLSLVLVPGVYSKIGGASRWLNLPLFGGQPGEIAKLALVLFLAKNLSRQNLKINKISSGVLPNFGILAAICIFLLVQKDLGTAVLLTFLTFTMLLAAGLNLGFIALAFVLFLAASIVAIIFEPYRINRIATFLDPWSEVRGHGFQIIQSFLAFTNGGFWGTGLGESKQKLFFLPEAHTDFILAVIGEEMGLIGVFALIGLFLVFSHIGYKICAIQTCSYRKFIAFGITTMLSTQALFNMGVVMGLLPTKGMPLPFVSSGNSSLLISIISTAILAKLAHDQEQHLATSTFSHC